MKQEFLNYDPNVNITKIIQSVEQDFRAGLLPQLRLPSKTELEEIEFFGNHIKNNFTEVVVVGTGASALIPRTISSLPNKSKINFHYLSNIDPTSLTKLLKLVDLKKACILVISKSGSTIEALAITQIIIDIYKQIEADFHKRFFFLSDNTDNPMRRIAKNLGAYTINHPTDIGGRFAILSSVSLIIAKIIELDIDKFLEGAKKSIQENLLPNSLAHKGAEYIIDMANEEKNNLVFLPYSSSFTHFNNWYRQIIAESLGKNNFGINPVMGIGTIDQHSQLQLYLNGPHDKFFTILKVKNYTNDFSVYYDDNNFYKLSFLLNSFADAVKDSLIKNNKNIRLLELDYINEENIGYIMVQFAIEIILIARHYNINPFDQPAVEDCKIRVKEILNS